MCVIGVGSGDRFMLACYCFLGGLCAYRIAHRTQNPPIFNTKGFRDFFSDNCCDAGNRGLNLNHTVALIVIMGWSVLWFIVLLARLGL